MPAKVRAGTVTMAEVFAMAQDDDLVKRTRVSQVLRAMPGWGPAKVAAVMATCGVEVKRRVGGLGKRSASGCSPRSHAGEGHALGHGAGLLG
ncbi:integration host factor, actinobacterial type [Streptosporangium roseum]